MAIVVNLRKGDAPVTIGKKGVITARASWSSRTDYDLYALILMTDGSVETVATFGAEGGSLFRKKKYPPQLSAVNGTIRHSGDVRRESVGDAQETIEIELTPVVRAVIPIAYSAQSNGTGSFHRYRVTLEINNAQGERVLISSENANNDDQVYTCAIGIIENTPGGAEIHALEEYSKRGSENRPSVALQNGRVVVTMDAGPRNDYK